MKHCLALVMNRKIFPLLLGLVMTMHVGRPDDSLCRIDGRLVDFFGNPLKDGVVTLINQSGDVIMRQSADGSGRFALTDISPGVLTATMDVPGFRRELRQVVLRDGDEIHLDVGMSVTLPGNPTTVRVAGTVRTPEGKAVSGAEVTLTASWNPRFSAKTSTNRSGRYSFSLSHGGQYELHVRARDKRSTVLVGRFWYSSFDPGTLDVVLHDDMRDWYGPQ